MTVPLFFGILVILAAVVAIIKQIDVRLVLFAAALALGALVGQTDVIVRKFLATFSDERFVIPICSAMGFSYVLRLTGCDQHLVRLLVKPLVNARSLLIPGTILVGFFVNMPLVSQTSTALAIGPVIIPILKAAQIPIVTIASALLLGSSIGGELFNPGAPELRTVVVESNKAAVARGEPDGQFTTARCIERLRPLNFLGLAVAMSVFWWRAPKDHPAESSPDTSVPTSDPAAKVNLHVNYLKAVVPVVPITLLILFAPRIGLFSIPAHWLEDVSGQLETRLIGAAMLVGVAVAIATTPRLIPQAADSFFTGAGFGFANIVSIIVAANCFGKGLELIGLAQVLTDHLAHDPRVLIATAGMMSLIFAVLCGSGMATAQSLFPFFAATSLELGVDPAHVGAVVSLAAAAGRTMSPLSAVNQMCARLTDTRAIDLTRQVAPPLLLGLTAIIVWAVIRIPTP